MSKSISTGYTVQDLIKALEDFPKDAKVVLSSDEEGNEFGLLGRIRRTGNMPILFPMYGTVTTEEEK